MDIPRIYHGNTSNDIPCISMDTPRMYLVEWIYVVYPWIYHVYPMYIGQDGIYMGYTW